MYNPFNLGEKENFPNTDELFNNLLIKIDSRNEIENFSKEDDFSCSSNDLSISYEEHNKTNDHDFTIETLSLLNPVSFQPNPLSPGNQEYETSFFDKTLNFLRTPPENVNPFENKKKKFQNFSQLKKKNKTES